MGEVGGLMCNVEMLLRGFVNWEGYTQRGLGRGGMT